MMLLRNGCQLFALSLFLVLPFHAKITVLFSPDDKPREKLTELINQSQKIIRAAIFIITDKKISQALVRAKKRGVAVQIVTDQTCVKNVSGKIQLLKDNGIEVFVYKPKGRYHRHHTPCMHNKFALIDHTTIWTGSMNWSWSACERNEENVQYITDEPEAFKRYAAQFEQLKRRCFLPKQRQQTNESLKDKIKTFLLSIRRKVTNY